jgi:hypothetical protein
MYRCIVFIISLALGLGLQSGTALCSDKESFPLKQRPAETPLILKNAVEGVKAQLQLIDQDLAQAAQSLSTLDLNGEPARAIIRQLQALRADKVIDVSTISPQGIMLLVEPAPYRSVEGTDISGQEHIQALLRTRQPVMSRVFRTVEGVPAVDIEHPVIRADGHYLGSVSAIFQPWVLIGKCVNDLVAGMPVEIWAMQPDGMIIYDADPHEVGRMLFSDPLYQPFPELLQLGRRIAAEAEGSGSYSYFKAGTHDLVQKDAWWVSVTLHDTVWRLVSIHPAKASNMASSAGARPFSRDALHALAREASLIHALARGDQERAMSRFQQVVMAHNDVYSLSFIDARAVNRFGYPRENSLFDVDLRKQTDAASVAIVTAMENREELFYRGPLVEGGQACYWLMPVLDGQKYLGSLLWIQKEP